MGGDGCGWRLWLMDWLLIEFSALFWLSINDTIRWLGSVVNTSYTDWRHWIHVTTCSDVPSSIFGNFSNLWARRLSKFFVYLTSKDFASSPESCFNIFLKRSFLSAIEWTEMATSVFRRYEMRERSREDDCGSEASTLRANNVFRPDSSDSARTYVGTRLIAHFTR